MALAISPRRTGKNNHNNKRKQHPSSSGSSSNRSGVLMMAEETTTSSSSSSPVATPAAVFAGGKRKGEYQPQLPRLVLVGAGFANLQVTKLLSDSKLFESITLIDVEPYATYCGVIPCSLAPKPSSLLLSAEEEEEVVEEESRETAESTTSSSTPPKMQSTAIDLQNLCYLHNITFVNDGVVDIDPWKQVLYLTETQQPIPYDILSLDIGTATKSLDCIPGAFDYAIPIRPMHELQSRLEQAEQQPEFTRLAVANSSIHEEQITEDLESNLVRLVVVGDGALSIELALCMEARWRPILGVENLHVVLVTSDSTLLPEHANARKILKNILMERNITLCFHASVIEVLEDRLCLDTGMEIPYNYCLWATGGEPHDLIKTLVQQRRGLNVTEEGWIAVTDALQSTSHPNIFAAGDCCSSVNLTLPKATGGIHTLQEGPILAHNLEHYASHQRLQSMPSSSLQVASGGSMQFISCGDGTAIGFAFGIPMRGRFVWEIKNAMNNEFFALINGDTTATRRSSNQEGEGQQVVVPIPPAAAAAMFRSINVENYRIAWSTLQYMTKNERYRSDVLKCYNAQQLQLQQQQQQQQRNSFYDTATGHNKNTTTPTTIPPAAATGLGNHSMYCRDDKIFKGPHPHQTTA